MYGYLHLLNKYSCTHPQLLTVGSIIVRELCRYMKYKEKEAIKESVDKLNQYKHQKRDGMDN